MKVKCVSLLRNLKNASLSYNLFMNIRKGCTIGVFEIILMGISAVTTAILKDKLGQKLRDYVRKIVEEAMRKC